MPATVNANLFRVVAKFISTEATRYYLQGVLIQRHQTKGVYLVATDGHRAMVAYDEHGSSDLDDVIVGLDKHALSACKADKHESLDRVLTVHGDGEVIVSTGGEDARALSSYRNCIIDGTFPDWRRIVPNPQSDNSPETFSGVFLSDFCAAAKDLDKHATKTSPASIRVYGGGGNPALIRFLRIDNAFGILMPVADKNADGAARLPAFLSAAPMTAAAE